MSTQVQEAPTGTLAELRTLEGFLERAASEGMSERNRRAHAQALGRFAEYLAPRRLDESTEADAGTFLAWLGELGVSPASLEAYRAILCRWHEHLAWTTRLAPAHAGATGAPRAGGGEGGGGVATDASALSSASGGGESPEFTTTAIGRRLGEAAAGAAPANDAWSEPPTDENIVVILDDGDDVTPVSSSSPFAPRGGSSQDVFGDETEDAAATCEMDALTAELARDSTAGGAAPERRASPLEEDGAASSAGDEVRTADEAASSAVGGKLSHAAAGDDEEPFEGLEEALLSAGGPGAHDVPDIDPITGFIDEMAPASGARGAAGAKRDASAAVRTREGAPSETSSSAAEPGSGGSSGEADSPLSQWGGSSPSPADGSGGSDGESIRAPVRQLRFPPVGGAGRADGSGDVEAKSAPSSSRPAASLPFAASSTERPSASGTASGSGTAVVSDGLDVASSPSSAGTARGAQGGIPLARGSDDDFEVLSTGEDSASAAVSRSAAGPAPDLLPSGLSPVGGSRAAATVEGVEVSARWAVQSGSAERDGITLDALKQMAVAGQIGPKTMVRKPSGEWVRASALRPLRRALGMSDGPATGSVRRAAAPRRASVPFGLAGSVVAALVTALAWWIATLAAGDEVAGVLVVGGALAGLATRLAARNVGLTVAALAAAAPVVGLLAGRYLVWETVMSGVTLDGFVRSDDLVEFLVWGLDGVAGACLAVALALAAVLGATPLVRRH